MTQNEFELRRRQAVENMRQMNARSTAPSVEQPKPETHKTEQGNIKIKNSPLGANIPFLDFLSTDKDAALIIGLLLILMSERSDKTLLFALVYILL